MGGSAERPQPAQVTLDPAAVETRLATLTGAGGRPAGPARLCARSGADVRSPPGRAPATHRARPGGHGHGQDAGLSRPASLWTQQSGGTVWVSTYTKALQRQLRREHARLCPAAARQQGAPPVVVRKGRENYLCLLNLEDALQGGFTGRPAILAQLVARWAAYSQDGDMIGGDLPGWLGTLFRKRGIAALTDQRGECVYAGCPHYRKCFIERAARASAEAELVIANHALVMVNAARGRDAAQRPRASCSTKATMCSTRPTARSAPR
jgi:ATP-dependent DNA helicase DinG